LEGDKDGREGVLQLLLQNYRRSYSEDREALEQYMSLIKCKQCGGKRLAPASLAVLLKGLSIADFTGMPISRALLTVRSWEFNERELQIVGRIIGEIKNRLEFLS